MLVSSADGWCINLANLVLFNLNLNLELFPS